MKKINIFSLLAITTTLFATSCKTNQTIFAGAAYSGYVLLVIFFVLLVWVMKKFM